MAVAEFPKKQEDKNNYFLEARTRIGTRQTALSISADNKTAIDNLMDNANGWIDINAKHVSTDGNTSAVQERFIQLIGLVEERLTLIYKDIPTSALISEDYTVFRFNAGNSSHAHIIAQSIPGNLTVEGNNHLLHKLRIKNPLTPESDAMPHGNHAKVWFAVSPTKVTNADIKWDPNPKAVTIRFYEHGFTDAEVGQFAAYCTCYENKQGEQGAKSEVLWVPIW